MKRKRLLISLLKESIRVAPGNFIAISASTVLSGLATVLSTFFPALLIDCLVSAKENRIILFYILAYSVIICLVEISHKAASLYSTATGYRANNIATLRIQQKAMRIPYDSWDSPEHFQKIKQAVNSSWVFQTITDAVCGSLLSAVIILLPAIYIVSRIHILLLVFLLVLILIEMRIEEKFDEKKYAIEDQVIALQKKSDYDEKVLTEIKYGKEVRLFKMKDGLIHRYLADRKKENDRRIEQSRVSVQFTLISLLFSTIEAIIVYLFAIIKYNCGEVNIADFFAYVGAVMLLVEAVKQIGWAKNWIKDILNYYVFYYEFMQTKEEEKEKKLGKENIQEGEDSGEEVPLLQMSHVGYRYENAAGYALDDICLKINKGEKVAIVGENGAGKSTLVKTMLHLYDNYSGDICYKGKNIRDISVKDYYKRLSSVFQDYFLHAFSIRENITFDKETDKERLHKLLLQYDLVHILEPLEKGIDTWYSKELCEDGIELSGGECQKLATVRGLYKDADILVLDESTAALDPIAEKEYYNTLFANVEQTIIFITHRMASTRRADKIIVIDKGKIAETGTFDELYSRHELFYSFFSKQAELYEE